MNAKKAKELRKEVSLWKDAGYTKKVLHIENVKHEEVHYKVGYRLNERGEEVAFPYPVTNPILLEENCGRKVYQNLKKARGY